MKFKKVTSLLLVGAVVSSLMVGCSEKEMDTTEGLTDLGTKSIANAEGYDYKKLDGIDNSTYSIPKYERVKICGKVDDIDVNSRGNTFKIWLEVENRTPYPLRINIPKHMVDVKFEEGDTITVYGTLQGIIDDPVEHWVINGYFIELGDATDKEIGKEKVTEEKVDKNIENKTNTKENTEEKQESETKIKNKKETKKSKTKKENKNEEIEVKKEQQDKTNDEEDDSQTCVVCGEFVPVSSMCECDGTIHHEYCKHYMYHCPNCRRKSTSDPYVYGCAWCGWTDNTDDVEEYDIEDTTDDDGEDIKG